MDYAFMIVLCWKITNFLLQFLFYSRASMENLKLDANKLLRERTLDFHISQKKEKIGINQEGVGNSTVYCASIEIREFSGTEFRVRSTLAIPINFSKIHKTSVDLKNSRNFQNTLNKNGLHFKLFSVFYCC